MVTTRSADTAALDNRVALGTIVPHRGRKLQLKMSKKARDYKLWVFCQNTHNQPFFIKGAVQALAAP
ncbi:hypothetical protein EMVG_00321 [Emiliania huxleyi virus PS401]|nr:hypothetical protein EMVG_00321 [Emiliania huxleyi virus PS401]